MHSKSIPMYIYACVSCGGIHHWNYHIWLLRVTLGIPWVFKTEGIFGRLFLYSTNINENTQGNPGLPWVIAEFWRHIQQNPGYFKFQGIPWVFEADYVFKYININFE